MLETIKREKFSLYFTSAMLLIGIASILMDFIFPNDSYWFQRSGAMIVLAGVESQYTIFINRNKKLLFIKPPNTHNIFLIFLSKIKNMFSQYCKKDIFAIWLIVSGTVIWAYGDLPFKTQ